MSHSRHLLASACLAAALPAAATLHAEQAIFSVPPPGKLILMPGQSLADAVRAQAVKTRADGLRRAWQAGGRTAAETYTGPTLLSGKVAPLTLTIGNPFSLPKMSFVFDAGTVGLSFSAFTFTSPSGTQSIQVSYGVGPFQASGKIAFTSPAALPLYSQSGIWTLSGATLSDNAGNTTNYTASQLTPIFSATTFLVANTGLIDDTPPTITSAQLNTTTLSLSSPFPQLTATFGAKDSGSGVYEALLFLQPPGQTYMEAQIAPLPLPIKAGKVTAYDTFNQYYDTGVYTISQFTVCDAAGNCLTDNNAADLQSLFGTTSITVTP